MQDFMVTELRDKHAAVIWDAKAKKNVLDLNALQFPRYADVGRRIDAGKTLSGADKEGVFKEVVEKLRKNFNNSGEAIKRRREEAERQMDQLHVAKRQKLIEEISDVLKVSF